MSNENTMTDEQRKNLTHNLNVILRESMQFMFLARAALGIIVNKGRNLTDEDIESSKAMYEELDDPEKFLTANLVLSAMSKDSD
jgi:hypothetical protein